MSVNLVFRVDCSVLVGVDIEKSIGSDELRELVAQRAYENVQFQVKNFGLKSVFVDQELIEVYP